MALIVAFMIAEVIIGVIAGSIATISDAGYLLTDTASIVLALIAMRLSARARHRTVDLRVQTRRNPLPAGQRSRPVAVGALVIYEAVHR